MIRHSDSSDSDEDDENCKPVISRKVDDKDEKDESDDAVPDAVGGELPQHVYLHKSGQYWVRFTRGGKTHYCKPSDDIDWLVKWKADKDKELDAANVPQAQKRKKYERAALQSETPGVRFDLKDNKWYGSIYDRLQRKQIHTSSPSHFVDEKKCAATVEKLRVEEKTRFEAEMTKRLATNPKLTGLPRAPEKPTDAQKKAVYWHVNCYSKYVPYRAIVVGAQKQYLRACQECYQQAQFNPKTGEKTHCNNHGGGLRCPGPEGCTECPLGISVQNGKKDIYDGYCVRCFCYSFPNDPRAARARKCIHVRENTTVAELKKHVPDYNWTFDKKFSHRTFLIGVQTRFRPDARTTQGDRIIIVEIDEQSHRRCLCATEREREYSFVKQNREKTVVMVRYNPDEYTDYNGVYHPSCFTSATKDNEVPHIHPKRKAVWQARIQELVNTVRTLSDPAFTLPPKQPDRPLLICELFYDDVMATPEDKRVAKAMAAAKTIGATKAGLKRKHENL